MDGSGLFVEATMQLVEHGATVIGVQQLLAEIRRLETIHGEPADALHLRRPEYHPAFRVPFPGAQIPGIERQIQPPPTLTKSLFDLTFRGDIARVNRETVRRWER